MDDANPDDHDTENEIQRDREHFVRTLGSFKFFGVHMMNKFEERKTYFESLTEFERNLVPDFKKNMEKLEACLLHNNELLTKIIEHSAPDIFNGEHNQAVLDTFDKSSLKVADAKRTSQQCNGVTKMGPFAFSTSDMDKVRSTLKQFARDWSSVGAREREMCYQPVIDDICELYSSAAVNPRDVHILVPGAGLGRLAWELAHRGYTCQGNEWSLHMLIPAYFILNTCRTVNEHTIYPWAPHYCNNLSRSDQLAPVHFPDVSPTDLPDVPFSMAAGDFVEIYTEPELWDCVATVFFIDTSHNILSYLQTIWKILKPGGVWINLGPLLYHFSDVPGEPSLELSYEEIRTAIDRLGFEVVRERTGLRCSYTQNPSSMLSYKYSCVYGVFRKPTTDPRVAS